MGEEQNEKLKMQNEKSGLLCKELVTLLAHHEAGAACSVIMDDALAVQAVLDKANADIDKLSDEHLRQYRQLEEKLLKTEELAAELGDAMDRIVGVAFTETKRYVRLGAVVSIAMHETNRALTVLGKRHPEGKGEAADDQDDE